LTVEEALRGYDPISALIAIARGVRRRPNLWSVTRRFVLWPAIPEPPVWCARVFTHACAA